MRRFAPVSQAKSRLRQWTDNRAPSGAVMPHQDGPTVRPRWSQLGINNPIQQQNLLVDGWVPGNEPTTAGAIVQRGRRGRGRGKQIFQPSKQAAPKPAKSGGANSGSGATVTAQNGDRTMSFRDLPPGPVSVYRMEVVDQSYDKDGRARYPHVHQGPSTSRVKGAKNQHVYLPKPTENYSTAKDRYVPDAPTKKARRNRKGISTDDPRFSAEFLKTHRDTGRNTVFMNFGDRRRAYEFYRQKVENEPKLNFNIKSAQVPHHVFDTLRQQAVHEDDARSYPTRPFNVDRKVPNQLGLRERHVDLLNRTAIPGSAKVEDIAALQKEFEKAGGAASDGGGAHANVRFHSGSIKPRKAGKGKHSLARQIQEDRDAFERQDYPRRDSDATHSDSEYDSDAESDEGHEAAPIHDPSQAHPPFDFTDETEWPKLPSRR